MMVAPTAWSALMASEDDGDDQERGRLLDVDALLDLHGFPSTTFAGDVVMADDDGVSPLVGFDPQMVYLQRQDHHHHHHQNSLDAFLSADGTAVPPTPLSLEMAAGLSSPPEQLVGYDGSCQHDMAFTPLVSPAVTPLDAHFGMENAMVIPGACFSPLTSPALHAQQDASSSLYDGSLESPIDMDLDLAKRSTARRKARGKPGIKSSPIAKPQRRRTALVSQALTERTVRAGHQLLRSADVGSDESASVSPENLTDMPPPPVPNRRSNSESPYTPPQNGLHGPSSSRRERDGQQQLHPATPASLMKLPASDTTRPQATGQQTAEPIIESLELPESLTDEPDGSTWRPTHADPTPVRAPTVAPFSLPSPAARTASEAAAVGQSPQLRPSSSGAGAKRAPLVASRGGRDRSTGSVHASPALLPKISPSIKPLLPGTPADDTASRLLMSKSNYQNLVEGNTVPGVTYPSELSTNLTSKRTSHKIAEQGRRNRINSALHVMAGLLTDQHQSDTGDETEGKQASTANSKASVVEKAIVHIKKLHEENGELKQQVRKLRAQLERLGASSEEA
ncbi:hypothetical protein XA68_17350 [Ophiocordyceps unilateralis]|uniref:BHLH domain-containing protein n=1 Tax=Ophiocordyceps unilateralis TaxID=268505 RepID=A0A2A9PKV1_OPHUN|nr:hypothetical protein XA68_17350 [Ophiocordyceps unilateralis]